MIKGYPKDIVLAAHADGAGDWLIYSTLIEMFARAGHTVHISSRMGFRNDEFRAVFLLNPFHSGFSDDPPNAGGCRIKDESPNGFIALCKQKRYGSIRAMEKVHGLEPTHTHPVIYYQPKWRAEFRDSIVADPASISQAINPDLFKNFVYHTAKWNGFDPQSVVVLRSKHAGINGKLTMTTHPQFLVGHISEYLDIMFSASLVLTAESGSQCLASAVKGLNASPRVLSQFTTWASNDKLFVFDNVEYDHTGQMQKTDYSGYP